MIIKNCIICNKEFRVKPYMENKAKFCSLKCFGINIKGKKSWIYGKKHNKESLKKMRIAKLLNPSKYWLGKKFTIEHRGKISIGKLGHKAPKSAFKKGVHPWNYLGIKVLSELQKLHYTREYRDWRKKVLTRDNYMCKSCESNEHLETDHIKPFSLYPEFRFDVNNGRTLCHECHKKTETYGSRVRYL